jgi:hypothetical protein
VLPACRTNSPDVSGRLVPQDVRFSSSNPGKEWRQVMWSVGHCSTQPATASLGTGLWLMGNVPGASRDYRPYWQENEQNVICKSVQAPHFIWQISCHFMPLLCCACARSLHCCMLSFSKSVEVLLYSMLSDFRKNIAFRKVPWFRLYVLLVSATCRQK